MNTVLPQYKCHKVVRAARILAPAIRDPECGLYLKLDVDGAVVHHPITEAFEERHHPRAGSYLVQYEPDGYESVSPGPQFEEGYTRV